MKKYLILFIIAAVIISAGLLIFNRSPYTIDTPYEYPDDEKNIPVEIIEKNRLPRLFGEGMDKDFA